MHSINPRFTYLLTYLLSHSFYQVTLSYYGHMCALFCLANFVPCIVSSKQNQNSTKGTWYFLIKRTLHTS